MNSNFFQPKNLKMLVLKHYKEFLNVREKKMFVFCFLYAYDTKSQLAHNVPLAYRNILTRVRANFCTSFISSYHITIEYRRTEDSKKLFPNFGVISK
jgi:hypothetical protein